MTLNVVFYLTFHLIPVIQYWKRNIGSKKHVRVEWYGGKQSIMKGYMQTKTINMEKSIYAPFVLIIWVSLSLQGTQALQSAITLLPHRQLLNILYMYSIGTLFPFKKGHWHEICDLCFFYNYITTPPRPLIHGTTDKVAPRCQWHRCAIYSVCTAVSLTPAIS
jgi:hypothetical protein